MIMITPPAMPPINSQLVPFAPGGNGGVVVGGGIVVDSTGFIVAVAAGLNSPVPGITLLSEIIAYSNVI